MARMTKVSSLPSLPRKTGCSSDTRNRVHLVQPKQNIASKEEEEEKEKKKKLHCLVPISRA